MCVARACVCGVRGVRVCAVCGVYACGVYGEAANITQKCVNVTLLGVSPAVIMVTKYHPNARPSVTGPKLQLSHEV